MASVDGNGESADNGGGGENGDSGENGVAADDDLKSFGEILKALRKRAGLTQEQLHPSIRYSVQYIGSVEQGRRHPSARFMERTEEALNAFGVLTIAARDLHRRRGRASWFRRWAELEDVAITLNTYECRVVPGLLQPESYMRALIENVPPLATPGEVEARVSNRLDRQRILPRTPYVAFSFIIDQVVIERQTGGPEVTRELIDHLLQCAALPNVDLQIIPTVQPLHAGTDGTFRLLETEDNEWFGYAEGQQTGQVITSQKDVGILHQRYAKLRIQALNPADSVGLLKRMRGSL